MNATRRLDQHDYRQKYNRYASQYTVLESRMGSMEKDRGGKQHGDLKLEAARASGF